MTNGLLSAPDGKTQLGWSTRTFQRRLLEDGTGYQALLGEHRRRTAAALLGDPSLSIVQVAHKCGFSGAHAFRRALRRWSSEFPGEAPFARGRAKRS